MKVAAILVTAALAVGTGAIAQTRDNSGGETLGQKAGRVFDKAEDMTKRGVDKVRGAGHNAKENAKQEHREAKAKGHTDAKAESQREAQRQGDTTAMGAGKADRRMDKGEKHSSAGDRQARMDDAYANWKNQQKR